MKYDYIIVGAGLSGGILARELAEKYHKKVLIVERRNHIAGNLFDYFNEHEIKVQKYGPHVFHTNNDFVYSYITSFCTPIQYKTKCEVVIDGTNTPSPFNFKTIDQFYSKTDSEVLKNKLLTQYQDRNSVSIVELLDSNDEGIKEYAQMLFEKDYRPYTAKQWNVKPETIDPSVLKRVPIVLSYGDTYFYDKYEFIPAEGFTKMFENIIDYENIDVVLNENALDHITIDNSNGLLLWDGKITRIIYTGPVDELFEMKFGVLPYRSLFFEFISKRIVDYQPVAIVAYPQDPSFTRITEYTKMPFQDGRGWTTYAIEYPAKYQPSGNNKNEPYYPVLTKDSIETNKKYQKYARKFDNLILCGRLADFKYYNMDQAVMRAFEVLAEMEEKYGKKI